MQLQQLLPVALLTIVCTAGAQVPALGAHRGNPDANTATQKALVRILTPAPNQELSGDSMAMRFEANSALFAGTPIFVVQLDGNPPITTSRTLQPFRKLAPGAHTLTVQLVDVNRTPVQGGRATVQFFSLPQDAQKMATARPRRQLTLAGLTFTMPDPKQADSDLPPTSSPLPLISIIGFAILLAGIVSAMKTRS